MAKISFRNPSEMKQAIDNLKKQGAFVKVVEHKTLPFTDVLYCWRDGRENAAIGNDRFYMGYGFMDDRNKIETNAKATIRNENSTLFAKIDVLPKAEVSAKSKQALINKIVKELKSQNMTGKLSLDYQF
jgi:hypothetical protein